MNDYWAINVCILMLVYFNIEQVWSSSFPISKSKATPQPPTLPPPSLCLIRCSWSLWSVLAVDDKCWRCCLFWHSPTWLRILRNKILTKFDKMPQLSCLLFCLDRTDSENPLVGSRLENLISRAPTLLRSHWSRVSYYVFINARHPKPPTISCLLLCHNIMV